MSELKIRLSNEMKAAMKAKEKERLAVIRSIMAAIKQVEVDSQKTIEADADVLVILDKMLKQRKDSHQQFLDADRNELAEQEAYEMSIIRTFLPQQLGADEILKMVEASISQVSAQTMQDMGKVMGLLKPKMQGRADMSEVSKLIKAKLS